MLQADYNPFSLEGKRIVVTGASSGIGRATAIECSKLGAAVIICGRNEERLTQTMAELAGTGHSSFVGDFNDDECISALVKSIDGEVDGAVLCAGKSATMPLKFATREKLVSTFETNFFSNFELMRQLYKSKKIAKGGSIVLISSIAGNTVYEPANGVYGATKSALTGIARYASVEFAQRRVRVNCICPGMVETPLIHSEVFSAEQLELDMSKYPLKRYGQPQEIAYSAIYLLSDASSWVTGLSLTIDGGRSWGGY